MSDTMLRVFTDGRATVDARLTTPHTLNDVYTFPKYATKAAWEKAARDIREHILATTGLLPMPEKCPLNARISGLIAREGYTVEKVLLETWPGFFLGGSLYRPSPDRIVGATEKAGGTGLPAIINPHGHWQRGRVHHDPQLGTLPGRFINLARQGYVTFAYDMIGYNDTFQLPHDFGGDREALWGISLLGLQLWNSIRAVDFVESLPEVDPKRIGCTGASGGGSQTFLLTAIEPRIAASLPAVMVSSHMQGGCLCENAPSLRLRYSNVQIAACTAPRPLHLIGCSTDWTRNLAKVEYPAIRDIYKLYGAEENVSFFTQKALHNYNLAARESCYAFFGKHFLGIDDPEQLREQPFEVESDDDLLALPDKRLPEGARTRHQIVRMSIAGAKRQLSIARPKDAEGLAAYRKTFGAVLQHAMQIALPTKSQLDIEDLGAVEGPSYTAWRLLIGRKGGGDKIPALLFTPKGAEGRLPGAVVVHEYGKAALMSDGLAMPGPMIAALLAEGRAVLAVDAFRCGEFNAQAGIGSVRNCRADHFTTYNRQDGVEAAQDILTAIAALKARAASKVDLVGLGEAGLWCLLAAAASPAAIERLVADVAEFRDSDDAEYLSRLNVPHLRRAGGIRAAVALFAPKPLMLLNCGEAFGRGAAKRLYRAAGDKRALRARKGGVGLRKMVEWLVDE
jgi:dienelactone hydrolase